MSWRADAACRGVDPGLFFPERGESASEPLRVCAGCPVRAHCLADALDREEMGVWGGMTALARRRLRRVTDVVLDRPENVIIWHFLQKRCQPDDVDDDVAWAAS